MPATMRFLVFRKMSQKSQMTTGSSCTVQVTFTPTVAGSAKGQLTFTDDAGTQRVGLSGRGQ